MRRLTTSVRESPTSNLMKKHGPGWGERVWGGVGKSDEERETGGGPNEVKSQQKGGLTGCGRGWLGVIVNAKSIKAL